ncbi:MAG: hypothetical protein ABMA25_05390 [Ilumatobacteraceae bacterium]
MHASRVLHTTLRPVWVAAAGAAVWANRAHIRSALGFGKKPGQRIDVAHHSGPDERPIIRTVTATEEVRSWD